MKNIQNEIKKIERKDWHLWILTSGVFLSLVAFILLLIFYSDVRNLYEKEFSSYTYNLLFVGFTGIALLFLAYILFKEKSIKKLSQELYQEKVLSQSLEERFQELKALFEVSTLVNSEIELSLILDMISKQCGITCRLTGALFCSMTKRKKSWSACQFMGHQVKR